MSKRGEEPDAQDRLRTDTDPPGDARNSTRHQVPADPQVLTGRDTDVGDLTVHRLLPDRERRTIGAWCFVDTYGPHDITGRTGMRVGPHHHIGLQTVTWLVEGEVLHRDSLGSLQVIRPGQLNLMSSGIGIAHSEESPAGHGATLQGVQLWIALPEGARQDQPLFEHHRDLPRLYDDGITRIVIVGSSSDVRSPATVYSPLVGMDVTLNAGTTGTTALDTSFEHAVLPLTGLLDVEGLGVPNGALTYFGPGRSELSIGSAGGARFLLLGGIPLREDLVMWWNFVGRTVDEISDARADWESGRRFGSVIGYPGERVAAPPLPAHVVARNAERPLA